MFSPNKGRAPGKWPVWLLGLALTLMFSTGLRAEEEAVTHEEAAETQEEESEDATPSTATYVQLEPRFTINYQQGGRLRYMTLALSLVVADSTAALEVNAHSDAIRHEVIMLVSSKTDSTFKSHDGREHLKEELRDRLREVLERETGKPLVEQVYITDMILQG